MNSLPLPSAPLPLRQTSTGSPASSAGALPTARISPRRGPSRNSAGNAALTPAHDERAPPASGGAAPPGVLRFGGGGASQPRPSAELDGEAHRPGGGSRHPRDDLRAGWPLRLLRHQGLPRPRPRPAPRAATDPVRPGLPAGRRLRARRVRLPRAPAGALGCGRLGRAGGPAARGAAVRHGQSPGGGRRAELQSRRLPRAPRSPPTHHASALGFTVSAPRRC